MFGRVSTAALALCAAAALAFGVATASAHTSTAANKPLCRIGQPTNTCAANPAFARTICSSFVPTWQQILPGKTFNQGYFPSWTGNRVSCFYVVDGQKQGVYLSVQGGAFGASSTSDNVRHVGKAQAPAEFQDAWNMDMKYWQGQSKDSCPFLTQAALDQSVATNGPDGIPWDLPQKTTVAGYPAITWDWCKSPQGKVGPFDPAKSGFQHSVTVLAGDVIISATIGWQVPGDYSSSQLTPLVDELIAKYKKFG